MKTRNPWPMKGLTLAVIISVCACACATTSNRTKIITTMVVGAVLGGTVGAMSAPKNEQAAAHGLLWGGVTAASVGVAGLFIFDEQKRSAEFERQGVLLRKELDAVRGEGAGYHGPQLLYESNAPFGKDIPTEYQPLVRPGQWSVYKLNQWIPHGEGLLIHQDRMVKLVPPQLSPNNQTFENFGAASDSSPMGTDTKESGQNQIGK